MDSAVKRLYLFPLGMVNVPLGAVTLDMVSGCYLVQTNDGRNILIDSGTPPNFAEPGTPTAPITNVLEHLKAVGLSPDDIQVLICTHFDIDHVGYNEVFKNAEHIVQRKHYEVACSGNPRFVMGRAHWDNPTLRYRFVDGDTELLPGLMVIETSGHAPGHQSVLVHLPQTGAVLLTIDAVMFERMFTSDRKAAPADDNEEQLRASTQKLITLAEQEGGALVVFGHDGAYWRTLKLAPDFYE